jgi:hypothetical protein
MTPTDDGFIYAIPHDPAENVAIWPKGASGNFDLDIQASPQPFFAENECRLAKQAEALTGA